MNEDFQEMLEPFRLTYVGKDADNGTLEAEALGESLQGAAKLYSAVAEYAVHGRLPSSHRNRVVMFARPAAYGSFEHDVSLAFMSLGEMYPHFSKAAMSYVFRQVLTALRYSWTGVTEPQNHLLYSVFQQNDKLINIIGRSQRNQERMLEKMIDKFPRFDDASRPWAKQLTAPIGRTCSGIEQRFSSGDPLSLGEDQVRIIRGGESRVVTNQEYVVLMIRKINIGTGHCTVVLADFDYAVSGYIRDEALHSPNNVYTTALNQMTGCTIKADAEYQGRRLTRLQIIGARPL